MHEGFTAKPLGKGQIDQAFPLIRTIAPDLDVGRWRAFAAALIDSPGRSGILTVQNDRGYIHGLFSYRVEESLTNGRVLSADNFIVLDLFNLAGAARALLHAMDAVANDLHCAAIRTILPQRTAAQADHSGRVLDVFRATGHDVETLSLCKVLAPTGDNVSRGADAAPAPVLDPG